MKQGNIAGLFVTVSALALAVPAHAQTPPKSGAPEAEASAGKEDTIVVTATRTGRSGFTAPTPTTVIGVDLIQTRAATNIGELLNEVPSFRPTQTQQAGSLGAGAGATFVDLRGLGTVRTLVLVDGRRHVPSTTRGEVDINLIPASLVARTEVLTGGASASWGSDAVAGVVNIILKDKLQGVEGNFSYGQTDKDDGKETNLGIAAGTSFAQDRGHVMFAFEHNNNEGVGAYENARDWSRALPFQVSLPTTRAAGLPSRIITTDVHFSNRLAPGGIIPSGAGIPASLANTTFLPGGVPVKFNVGSPVGGNLMVGGDNDGYNLLTGANLINPVRRDVAFGRVTFDITPDISTFAEASYGNTRQEGFTANSRREGGQASGLTIRIDNAFLPASIKTAMTTAGLTSVPFGRIDTEIGNYRIQTDRESYRGAAGLEGSLGDKWHWDSYYQYGETHTTNYTFNHLLIPNYLAATDAIAGPGGTIVCRSLTTARGPADPGCVPYNVFGVGSPSQAAIDYVTAPATTVTKTRQQVAAINLRGEPFSLWAGPVSLAVGAEWREERIRVNSDANQRASRFDFGNTQPIAGHYNVKEVYGEVVVPLARDLGPIGSLDFNGAIRQTDYSISGSVTTWKVGGVLTDSSDQIRLRITRSRDIRAPNLQELFGAATAVTTVIRDPSNGNSTTIPVLTSGSTGLVPEVADTLVAGVVLSPKFLPGFRISADYYDIEISGVIATLGGQQIVDRCAAGATDLCGLVIRQNGTTGPISRVLNTQLNLNKLSTKGVDIEASYRPPFDRWGLPGDLTLRALGTYTKDLITVDSAGPIDRAKSTVPEWAWNLSATYKVGRFSTNVTARYVGERIIDPTLIGPDDPAYNPALPNSVSDNIWEPVWYFNVSVSYDVYSKDQKKLQLYAVVNNLFDRDPPLNGASPAAQNSSLYDMQGRFFRVGARFAF